MLRSHLFAGLRKAKGLWVADAAATGVVTKKHDLSIIHNTGPQRCVPGHNPPPPLPDAHASGVSGAGGVFWGRRPFVIDDTLPALVSP
jgi:hypothetical protein